MLLVGISIILAGRCLWAVWGAPSCSAGVCCSLCWPLVHLHHTRCTVVVGGLLAFAGFIHKKRGYCGEHVCRPWLYSRVLCVPLLLQLCDSVFAGHTGNSTYVHEASVLNPYVYAEGVILCA